jgi:beta-fructofuranosidase
VLGAQRNNGSGTVLHFHSPTLEQWTLRGELLPGSNNGYMCECPDLHPARPPAAAVLPARAGRADWPWPNANASCYTSRPQDDTVFDRPQALDYGPDFYAPQTLHGLHGERILWGWMGKPEQPDTPSVADGWSHCLSVPRLLSWHDGLLSQQPHPALQALRGQGVLLTDQAIHGDWQHAAVHGECAELQLSLHSKDASACHLVLRQGQHCHTRLSWLPATAAIAGHPT